MTTTEQPGPGETPRQRKNKRSKKSGRKQSPAEFAPMQTLPAGPIEAAAPVAPTEETATAPSPSATPAAPLPETAPTGGIQALANAYRDYTRKSLQDAQSFAEKLSAARSLDKAMETQSEFARRACETFAADARKIRELHRELFWQVFKLPNWPSGGPSR